MTPEGDNLPEPDGDSPSCIIHTVEVEFVSGCAHQQKRIREVFQINRESFLWVAETVDINSDPSTTFFPVFRRAV